MEGARLGVFVARPLDRVGNGQEVKTGTGFLRPKQQLAFPLIRRGGGIPRGLRADEAGLIVGQQSGAFEVIILRRP